VERVAAQALRRLEAAGAVLVETEVPDLARLIGLTTSPIQSRDFRPSVAAYLERYRAGVGVDELLAAASADVRRVLADFASPGGVHYVSAEAYRAARERYLPQLREAFRQCFAGSGAQAIVFPTTMVPAPLIGEGRSVTVRGVSVPFRTAIARNIGPGSTAGLPGLVLPAGMSSDGLPIALEFDAPAGADLALLALGLRLEQALGAVPAPRAAN
jgi:indoleacetamide hydrolase